MKPPGLIRRRVVAPLVALLKKGATPEKLAWSVAVGVAIGVNPLLGSTTVATLLVAYLFRLKIAASQIGTHLAYPLQLALVLPFLQAGSVLMGGGDLPLHPAEIFAQAKTHPIALVKTLWLWEWHALILWAALAAVVTPAMALLLTRVFARAMPKTRHTEF